MTKMILRTMFVLAFIFAVTAPKAEAASVSALMNVTLTVNDQCTISTQDVDLGTIIPDDADIAQGFGGITVSCGASYFHVAIDEGLYWDGTDRNVDSGSGDQIVYRLYTDSSRVTQWGDDDSNTFDWVPVNPSIVMTGIEALIDQADTGGSSRNYTVYSTAGPTSGNPPTGTYSDIVMATIYY